MALMQGCLSFVVWIGYSFATSGIKMVDNLVSSVASEATDEYEANPRSSSDDGCHGTCCAASSVRAGHRRINNLQLQVERVELRSLRPGRWSSKTSSQRVTDR